MQTMGIVMFGQPVTIGCDGRCDKAWGINTRPKIRLSDHGDDVVWLSDDELGEAPKDPGTYEGGCAKPHDPNFMNKWCARECERSTVVDRGDVLVLGDYSRRVFNQVDTVERT